MKKPFGVIVFIACFLSSGFVNLYAQKKDTSDYFAIGIYGGAFNGQFKKSGSNEILNSASVEVEYFKLENLSFYMQGLYKFKESGQGNHSHYPPMQNISSENEMKGPSVSILNISFGGRYYLRNKDVNPFVQLGINQLSYFNDGQNNRNDTLDYIGNYRRKGSSNLNIAINPGIGLSFRLSDQFNAVIKYDLLIGLTDSGNNLSGYSVLGGLKYSF